MTERSKYGMKALDKGTLEDLNYKAVKRDLNRSLTTEFVKSLDPDGVNIMSIVLFDHNGDSQRTRRTMHHRTQVLCKVTGQEHPVHVYLDVFDEDYSKLFDAEVLKAVQEEEATNA